MTRLRRFARPRRTSPGRIILCSSYPLWGGDVPALLKAFCEQAFRPGFTFKMEPGKMGNKLLTGKSARIVVTMGMPPFFYRWYFPRSQTEKPHTQHPGLLRYRADPGEPDRDGRGKRHQAPEMDRGNAHPGPWRSLARRA
ncbi:MAG TPA: NAD(P)H-dependent oxidoreductase [Candidatus Methylomirabilis sp.]|nr:NAD(P)H-dependent oxidoreductase [Candidatus Methylomirabilis sp.]